MAKVGIVMGSDSDMPIMSKAADILEKLGIDKCFDIFIYNIGKNMQDSILSQ